MTPRELYFILAPLGFSIFLTLALSTTFRHGWRYPYKWYTFAMLYLALCSISYVPLFDFLFDPILHPVLYVVHNAATSLFGPILMLTFLRLAQCIPAVNARILLILFPPFILYLLCYHFVPSPPLLLLLCLAYIAGVTFWWSRCISLKVRYQYNLPTSDEEEENRNPFTGEDITWMSSYARLIAILVIARWGAQTFLTHATSDWVKPQLLLILLVYLPAILLYEWRHSEYRYFDHLHHAVLPKAQPAEPQVQPVEMPHDRVLRAARVQMHTHGRLAPNAILPHLTAGNTTNALSAPTPGKTLAQGLAQLEQEGLFFLAPELTPNALAQQLGVDRRALNVHFHQQGTTFYDYIDRLRTAHAAQLLSAQPTANLDLVAQQCGYTSRSNFLRAFTNHFHCSPDQYRKTHLYK